MQTVSFTANVGRLVQEIQMASYCTLEEVSNTDMYVSSFIQLEMILLKNCFKIGENLMIIFLLPSIAIYIEKP